MDKQKELHPDKQPLELQRLSDTRWACRYTTVNALYVALLTILLTVSQVSESRDTNKVIEARGLYHQLSSFSFLLTLITFDKILTCTKHLSDQLQDPILTFP